MKKTRILFCSDVHLCHINWYGRTSEDRMQNMVDDLNNYLSEKPYEKIVFLGDYSLDFWVCREGGTWLNSHLSNTDNFIKKYASQLKAPYYMAPGNHEQYGYEDWLKIVGTPRDDSFVLGGYLFVSCDNFSGDLDPKQHSDGVYVPTKLDFIKKAMDENPGLPVILCGHYFDWNIEPDEFFDFLKNEKRITALFCGHDHRTEVTDLGERADHVCIYHDGHYSYSGDGKTPLDIMWGFCDVTLSDEGIDVKYVEPENTVEFKKKPLEHKYREQNHVFFKRRDI
ncbi:MAG: metallophosphoesterase family protein [Acutalibacteraceae bacterium]